MHGLRYVLLVGSFALLTAEAQAKCAMVAIVPKPLTAANTAIGPDGGVVVGLDRDGREGGRADSAAQKTWRFKRGGKLSEPTIKPLAPGLAVYEFTGDGATLVDDKQKPLVTVRRGKALAALPAPALRSAIGHLDQELTRRGDNSRLTIELAAAPPPGVLGVIVYVGKQPMNWAVLEPKRLTVRFDAGGHCGNDIPGTLVPTTGDITVAWFDNTGRVSMPSPAVAIKNS